MSGVGNQLPTSSSGSTLSAITWYSGALPHSAVFATGAGGSVYMDKDFTGFVDLGGDAASLTTPSAGLDAAGNPEVYAIRYDNTVEVNHLDGNGWVDLGGYAMQISATADNAVFAIGGSKAVYVNSGSGWVDLGGYAQQISAGVDGTSGHTEVFAIGGDNAAHVDENEKGWVDLGGYVTELGATTYSTLYAMGENIGWIYANNDFGGFFYLGSVPQEGIIP
jgi:hypothetical protein